MEIKFRCCLFTAACGKEYDFLRKWCTHLSIGHGIRALLYRKVKINTGISRYFVKFRLLWKLLAIYGLVIHYLGHGELANIVEISVFMVICVSTAGIW